MAGSVVSAMPGESKRRYSKRREELLKIALSRFAENGLHETGMKDIAKSLGLTHPALYHYFPSKNQIVFEAVEKAMLDLVAVLQRASEIASRQAAQRLIELIRAQLSHESTECRVVLLVHAVLYGPLCSAAILAPEQRERLVNLQDRIQGFYREVVAAGQETGEFAKGPVPVVSSALLSLVSYSPLWHCDDTNSGRHEVVEAVEQQALRSAGFKQMSEQARQPYTGPGKPTEGKAAAAVTAA